MNLPFGAAVCASVASLLVAACSSSSFEATPDAARRAPDAHVVLRDTGVTAPLPDARVTFPDAGHPAPDAGHPTPDAARATPDAAHATPDAGHTLPDASAPPDATAHDATRTPDATTHDATVIGIPDVVVIEDVIMIGPPPTDGSAQFDVFNDAPKENACGICDRLWDCNGFTDSWVSTSSDSCAYYRGGQAVVTLWCEDGNDTIGFPSPNEAGDSQTYGTWKKTSAGLELDYNSFGTIMVIDCVPGT